MRASTHTLALTSLLLATACVDDALRILPPALQVTPDPVLVTVNEGELGFAQVSIANVGSGMLSVQRVVVEAPDGRTNLVVPSSAFSVGAGELRRVEIEVDAVDGVPADATLVVESDVEAVRVPVQTRVVDIDDPPAGCSLTATPNPVVFTDLERGETSTVAVTLTSNGSLSCTVQDVRITDGVDDGFAVTSLSNIVMAPGSSAAVLASLAVSVDAAAGVLRGALAVESAEGEAVVVPLSGGLDTPAICLDNDEILLGAITSATTRSVTVTSCGAVPATVTGISIEEATDEIDVTPAQALPVTLAVGDTLTFDIVVDPSDDGLADHTLTVLSDDPANDDRVRIRWGAAGDEECDNGADDDGDLLIDEDCVEGDAVGRAVALGEGRLMLWGDEHVLDAGYGTAPIAFWRNALGWLGGPSPVVQFNGWNDTQVKLAIEELGGALGSFDINTAGAGHVLVVTGPMSGTGLRDFIERGGGVLFLAIGWGTPEECVDGLDPATAEFPIRYACTDPAPWGPVAQLKPHPVTQGLGLDAVPFVNGRYVVEEPGTGSTVIALP